MDEELRDYFTPEVLAVLQEHIWEAPLMTGFDRLMREIYAYLAFTDEAREA